MSLFNIFHRIHKLHALLGTSQSLKFCLSYLQFQTPIELTIPGIKTPLLCRTHDSDIRVMWQVFGEKWFDIELDKEPQLIVDGGAYVGYTSVFFATRFPSATILAVEPNAENRALLKQNCADYDNIEVIAAAVWDRDVALRVENPDDESWMIRVAEDESDSADASTLRGVNLSSLLDSSGFETIDLLKLDIEGAEREVFGRNYKSWLSRTRHMFIELHERYMPGCEAAFNEAIVDEPFELTQVGEYTILQRSPEWQPYESVRSLFEYA